MKCCYLSVAGFFVSALSASAAADSGVPGLKEMNFLELLAKGGFMMYPLGLMSVITVVLVLVFLMTIRRNTIVSDRFMNTTESLIRKRDYPGLISFCHRRNECMARIAQKTMDFITANPNASFESIRDVAQVEGSHQSGMLSSRITYLADIGAIAPMVGLLGTVIGMIEAFIGISSGEVAGVKEMGMADGVAKALIATAGGLAISIPALAFYSIFRGRVQKYVSELEAAATHFVALLQPQFERPPSPAAPQYPASLPQRSRDDYAMPVASPLAGERPDLHGI
jgi:biopolymer transport protein ExbB